MAEEGGRRARRAPSIASDKENAGPGCSPDRRLEHKTPSGCSGELISSDQKGTPVKKSLRIAALLPAAAAVAVLAGGPASASSGGAGTVAGAVTITSPSSGIPLSTPAAIAYTFNSTVITGTMACSSGPGAYTGTINVTASGSGFGDQVQDAGSVGGTISTGTAAIPGSTVNGNISGTYTRVGSNVLVQLGGNATITSPAGNCSGPLSVTVVAEFVPDAFAPGTTNPNHAQFVGTFSDASVA